MWTRHLQSCFIDILKCRHHLLKLTVVLHCSLHKSSTSKFRISYERWWLSLFFFICGYPLVTLKQYKNTSKAPGSGSQAGFYCLFYSLIWFFVIMWLNCFLIHILYWTHLHKELKYCQMKLDIWKLHMFLIEMPYCKRALFHWSPKLLICWRNLAGLLKTCSKQAPSWNWEP